MTAYRLLLRPDAIRDIDEARDWYDMQEPGLGEVFVTEIDATMARITEGPGRYPMIDGEIRRALVRRFPYGVCFSSEGDLVVVIAVFHCAMSPERIRRRSP